jgi:uncharacterized protein
MGARRPQGERGLPDRGGCRLAAGPHTLPDHVLQAQRADLVAGIRDHHLDDEFHRARTADLSQVTVPLLSAANWAGFGLHARGNFAGFAGAASDNKWLQVHGGRHEEWFCLPQSLALQRRFFDCFLKGIDNGWLAEPSVQLHIRRPGERFALRKEQQWLLARIRWPGLYLDAASRQLRWEPRRAGRAHLRRARRGVTFCSGPLAAETEITGPLAATLYVSTSTTDADLFVTLRAFLPGGNGSSSTPPATPPCTTLAQGCLRLSHRRTGPAGWPSPAGRGSGFRPGNQGPAAGWSGSLAAPGSARGARFAVKSWSMISAPVVMTGRSSRR